jgi:hypothetical protein
MIYYSHCSPEYGVGIFYLISNGNIMFESNFNENTYNMRADLPRIYLFDEQFYEFHENTL